MRDRPAFARLNSSELRRGKPLTVPEAVAATACTVLSAIIVVSYLWARAGRLSPFAMLGFTIATAVVLGIVLIRRATADSGALLAAAGILAFVGGWLLWLAGPSLLPPGGGPDLTHHLMLVDFIERHWQLPDASLVAVLGEMTHYTPGLHLLAALVGAWTGTDGLHALYPLVACTVALKVALVFLIALRLLSDDSPRIPLALTAVVLLLLPQAYFLGSFFHDSFLAQVVAELFAVAMWWALVAWDAQPSRTLLLLFAAAGAVTFLTWPIWIGPPTVALVATVLTRDDLDVRLRVKHVLIALAPIAAIALLHAAGRVGWLGMAGTTGAVLWPAIRVFGWTFLVLATTGCVLAVPNRRARATLLLTISIAVQGVTLFLLARAQGASTPYMALKMVYLLIYPLAVFGALAIGQVWQLLSSRLKPGPTPPPTLWARASARAFTEALAWVLLLVTLTVFRRPLTTVPRPTPVVSADLYDAGRWARGQLEAACVDYLVPNADTMYWLHLAVLGNPRSSLRTADPDTFVPARAIARWIEPAGLPYGIADLKTLPKEVLNDVDVLEQFGTAAVVKRRGPSMCGEAERVAALSVSPHKW